MTEQLSLFEEEPQPEREHERETDLRSQEYALVYMESLGNRKFSTCYSTWDISQLSAEDGKHE